MPGTISLLECANQCTAHMNENKEVLMFSLAIMSVLWILLYLVNKFNILKTPGLKEKVTMGILMINASQTILLFLLL